MNYLKPALNFEQQAQRLLDRGLIGIEKSNLTNHLMKVNYYRLSAYWYPFRSKDPCTGKECFTPGTTFEVIWRRYIFDRQLRLIIMDAVEYLEIAILRTKMVEQFTLLHGPFGYCNITSYQPGFPQKTFDEMIIGIDDSVNRSNEEFIGLFQTKYTSEPHLPLWMVVEVMTYGQLYTMFRYMDWSEQKTIAKLFNLHLPVFDSWLKTLNYVRNVCAHHGRLWNRELPIRPQIPYKKHVPEFHTPNSIENSRIFSVLSTLRYLLKFIDHHIEWQNRLETLLQTYNEIPLSSMGFPTNWKEYPIWMK